MNLKAIIATAALAVAAGIGYFVWQNQTANDLPNGFAKSNGRIEAERVDVAAKLPGRIKQVLVKEGIP